MKRTRTLALLGVTATTALAGAAPALAGTTVSVRIEGKNKTLLATRRVTTSSGWLTRFGAPKGACSAASAAGALNTATHGRWGGKFEQSYGDYFITRILGDFESGSKYFWDIFVGNVSASSGACGVKLHRGEQLLFAAVPVLGTAYPLGLQGPSRAHVDADVSVKAVWFDARGRAKALSGALVTGSGVFETSNAEGIVHIHISHSGTLSIHASKRGYVRSDSLRIVEQP
jgi:Domain of unknown function (DUF4430)